MTATIHDFPLSNQKADRAFWKGETETVNPVSKNEDTAPSEFNSGWVQDSGDCA